MTSKKFVEIDPKNLVSELPPEEIRSLQLKDEGNGLILDSIQKFLGTDSGNSLLGGLGLFDMASSKLGGLLDAVRSQAESLGQSLTDLVPNLEIVNELNGVVSSLGALGDIFSLGSILDSFESSGFNVDAIIGGIDSSLVGTLIDNFGKDDYFERLDPNIRDLVLKQSARILNKLDSNWYYYDVDRQLINRTRLLNLNEWGVRILELEDTTYPLGKVARSLQGHARN